MKRTSQFLVILAVIALSFSCKKDEDLSACSGEKYFFAFTAKGEKICYSFVSTSKVQYDSVSVTNIISGVKTSVDSNIYPGIQISFKGNNTGIYSGNELNADYPDSAMKFSVLFTSDLGYFYYPSLFFKSETEYFELTISQYDLKNHIISGTFHGVMFNTLIENDSIVIENGSFTSRIYDISDQM